MRPATPPNKRDTRTKIDLVQYGTIVRHEFARQAAAVRNYSGTALLPDEVGAFPTRNEDAVPLRTGEKKVAVCRQLRIAAL